MLNTHALDQAIIEETEKPFVPSIYQAAIGAWATEELTGHALIDAFPGSGKTSTLKYLSALLTQEAAAQGRFLKVHIIAFNTGIRDDIKRKFEKAGIPASVSTTHGLGFRACAMNFDGKVKLEEDKYQRLITDYLVGELLLGQTRDLAGALEKIVRYVRLNRAGTDELSIMQVIADYNLEIDPADYGEFWEAVILPGVPKMIQRGVQNYQKLGLVDFTDQIWMIGYLRDQGVSVQYPQYDWLMMDECQDSSEAAQDLLVSCCRRGRIVTVGDKRQGIYKFAGAALNAVDKLVTRLNAKVFPLPICYRCPPEVVAEAAKLYPGIMADPNHSHGKVEVISHDVFLRMLTANDLVMCRTTAPLISLCLQLIRAGKRAKVKGRDIGKMMIELVHKLGKLYKQEFSMRRLGELAERYRAIQLKILEAQEDTEMQVEALNDRIDTFQVLIGAYLEECGDPEHASIPGFEAYITDFLTDKEGDYILLSTAHRAKGLEYERAFIYKPELMPFPKAKKPEDVIQERNLLYVAVTRAMSELYYVGSRPAPLDTEPEMPQQLTIIAVPQMPALVIEPAQAEPLALPEPAPAAAYIEQNDTCPGCGAACDFAGTCCWACGLVFNRQQEPEPELTPEQQQLAVAMEKALAHYDNNAVQTAKESLQAIAEQAQAAIEASVVEAAPVEAPAPIAIVEAAPVVVDPPAEETPSNDLVAQLLAEKAALEAEVQRLRNENERLRRLALHGDTLEMAADGDYSHLPNNLRPKVGRTPKEPKIDMSAKLKGTARRQPLQLSLDPIMIGIVKALRMNASGFFEEQLEAQAWYQEAKFQYPQRVVPG